MSERHWTRQRKAQLVQDVAFGRLARADALSANQITEEEFAAWERCYAAGGLPALAAGASTPQLALPPVEEPAPWRSAAAPSTLRELADWFQSQAQLCHRLAATYGREARLMSEAGDRRGALARMEFAGAVATQARSYEHAARLSADFGGATS